MCGIFGFVSKNKISKDNISAKIKSGLKTIAHRGPDGNGIWVSEDSKVGFGHVRLAIIDINSGSQPMHDPNGRFSIVFNGEIYNYLELKKILGGTYRTNSDTEVILKAYEKWGEDSVNHLRGMFAFAIWDKIDKKLFLARDRFGIKPLYLMQNKEGFYFASEIKSLLPFQSNVEINQKGLSDYFKFQFNIGINTLFKNIKTLPQAHFFIYSQSNNFILKKYWEVHYDIDYKHTEKWFINRLKELLDDSVSMHLRSDVEVGSYVSGGIDSSLLATLATKVGKKKKFKIFNGRFLDDINFDESKYALSLARKYNMDCIVTDISEQDFVNHISKVIWHLDHPIAGPGSFAQYMVSKEASKYLKVVLGGQGGDEIFGGYVRYLIAYFEQCIKGAIEGTLNKGNFLVTYESIIDNLQSINQYKPMLKEFWSSGIFETLDKRYLHLINREKTFSELIKLNKNYLKQTNDDFFNIFWGENVGKESYFDLMTHFDFKTLLPALLHVEDRMSMAHGLESRVPLLDHPLVEFAATIPADIKFKNGELKRLLKVTYANILPSKITNRKDKMGFPVPLNLWLKKKGPAKEFIFDTLNSRKAKNRNYIKKNTPIEKLIDSNNVYSRNLWAILSLELWQNHFIDK